MISPSLKLTLVGSRDTYLLYAGAPWNTGTWFYGATSLLLGIVAHE